MLALIALAYWLMCVRLKVCVQAAFSGAEGNAMLSIGAFGLMLRYDAKIALGRTGVFFRALPRYKRKKTEQRKSAAQRWISTLLKPYLRSILLGRRFDSVEVHVRIGLDEADQTALLCGAVRALLCMLFMSAESRHTRTIRVTPDFSGTGVCIFAQGIFSCQSGDIMLAALKDVRLRKHGKEGFGWKSIPLRA